MDMKPLLRLSLELIESPAIWIELQFEQWPSAKQILEAKKRAEKLRAGVAALETAEEKQKVALEQLRNRVKSAERDLAHLQGREKNLGLRLEQMPEKWFRKRAEVEALLEEFPAQIAEADRALSQARLALETAETGANAERRVRSKKR